MYLDEYKVDSGITALLTNTQCPQHRTATSHHPAKYRPGQGRGSSDTIKILLINKRSN